MPVGVDRVGRDRRGLVVERRRDRQKIAGRQADEIGKAAVAMHADIAAPFLAQRLAAAAAAPAMPAGEIEIDRAAVADLDVGHAVADRDDVAAELVAHDARGLAAHAAGAHVEQRQPDAGGAHLHHAPRRAAPWAARPRCRTDASPHLGTTIARMSAPLRASVS